MLTMYFEENEADKDLTQMKFWKNKFHNLDYVKMNVSAWNDVCFNFFVLFGRICDLLSHKMFITINQTILLKLKFYFRWKTKKK